MCLAYPGLLRPPRLRPASPAPCASPTRDACARRDSAPRAPPHAPRFPGTPARAATPPREPRPMRLAHRDACARLKLRPSCPAPCASLPRDACARRDSAPGARLPARPAPRSALPSGRRACGGVSGGTDARDSRLRALVARCRPTHSGALGSLYHTYPHGTTKEAGAKRGAGLAYSAVWSE
ncbi:unnamed protein product [Nyctereutes procyonoides]|uniref:(raccoon dog) hypothetical protein n=1 Tax=Nyctereutes procyonoides TaxID=34880 RepID=A0A811YA01_NYCPR|nr:unnamed protein product [Nyctereutes procyonoides]